MHIKNPTIIALTSGMLTLGANAAVTITKDVRSATTWDALTITTVSTSETTSFIDVKNNSTSGLGQSFTATITGNVDLISLGVTRMYAGMDGILEVYQMFDGDGTSPGANPTRFRNGNSDWMSNAITTIPFVTTSVNINSSGDGNNMYSFALTGADQFAVTSGATYMVKIAGTAGGNGDNLALLDKVDSSFYADGIYGFPDGGTTASGRDLLLGINIAPIPEPSSALLGALGLLGLLRRRR